MAPVDVSMLMRQQNELAGPIERAITNLKKIGEDNLTKRRIQGRLDALKTNWAAYRDNHERIVSIRNNTSDPEHCSYFEKHKYFVDNQYYNVEEAFLDAQADMETRLDTIIAAEPASAETMSDHSVNLPPGATPHSHRLPAIDIPKFDGDPRNWITFRDLFNAVIGSSPHLSNVEKLHYLKVYLRGSPAQRVEAIALNDENFVATWDYLKSVYDDKRFLVNTAMRDFFDTKPVVKTSGIDLDRFTCEITRALTTLETLGQYTNHSDAFVVYTVVSKLDANTVREWEESLGSSRQMPTWVRLLKFLETRARSLKAFEIAKPRLPLTSSSDLSKSYRARQATTVQAAQTIVPTVISRSQSVNSRSTDLSRPSQDCAMCGDNHYVASCQTFRIKTPEQRKAFVTEKNLCYNCLGFHKVTVCRSNKRCLTCNGNHHTLIHPETFTASQTNSSTPARTYNQNSANGAGRQQREQSRDIVATTSAVVNHVVSGSISRRNVLLTTAFIRVQSSNGMEVKARALLDTGSELSFITESLAQFLKLPRERVNIPLVGIGAQQSGSTRGAVTCLIRPRFNSNFSWQLDALTLPKVTAELPSLQVESTDWTHLQGLQLADPEYATSTRVDLLLGSDIYGQLLETGIKRGPIDSPVAHRTKLGWVLSGPTSSSSLGSATSPVQGLQCSIDYDSTEWNLQNGMQRFWIQEEVQLTSSSAMSSEEEECEAHFLSTHSRDASGRYIVHLPFKSSPDSLGDSRKCALRMLFRVQKRLASDPELRELYSEFLQSYESLGHMRPASDEISPTQRVFYLPHHGVRKKSTTSKLRVVFNGSARTTSGLSLNDVLQTGAKLQTDLSDVILRWQRYQFAFSADIEKMFRQILVHPDDWNFQRIIWNADSSQPIHDYQLTTVTYGLGPAPFLAIRVLRQLVEDEGSRFPLAADIIRRNTYVDDTFGGADSLAEAQLTVQQLDNLCMAGGFKLQKWTANYAVVLSDISPDRHATSNSLNLNDDPLWKTLGIAWKPSSDSFEFSGFCSTQEAPHTKRKVLSRVSQLFDPLGWLAPVMIRAKIFMQVLWLAQIGWDDPLPDVLLKRWMEFLEQLENIPRIAIPRWLGTTSDMVAVEIHGFADASELAMAAVVYLRVLRSPNDAHLALLGSKTKVAPIKSLTIPRLELTAATLLARQVAHIRVTLNLEQTPVHLWTDSTVTLAWIQGQPSRWKDYVRNRVTTIHDTVGNARWHHVSGHDNPADCASRGLTPQQLKEHRLWWKGPDWLARPSTSWPNSVPTIDSNINLEERTKVVATARASIPPQWNLLERFSSLNRLLRITATCRRFFSRISPLSHPLTPLELDTELFFWVEIVQRSHFDIEIRRLAEGRSLPASHSLNRLIPFLDPESGLLRLGGRLNNSFLDPDTKHPIIMPKESHLATLIITEAHEKTLHGGTQATLAYIRRRFWILGGRVPVRSHILRCVRCARYRRIAAQQLMGQLPKSRSTPSRPFHHSGVDYAGPLTIKAWRGRTTKTHKGYIVLFVCFSTSAIHLEAVTDYSTDGFLAAFKRFTGRRGICATLSSDCGTNLVGADNELRRMFTRSSKELGTLATLLANDGTEWRFNPPSAPHFGGKWEAGVKSVKFHLRRVIGDTILTYEELSTLLIEIEAVLNSRPLCPLSDDPADLNALTPGHFLVGSALSAVPEPSLSGLPVSRLSRWQLVTQMFENFWTRWTTEYLQRFQAISKWHQRTELVKLGTLVLIIDERYPPSKWPLARVIEEHPGADGLIRVVTVRTQNSTFKRPIVKLCPLPVHAEEEAKAEL